MGLQDFAVSGALGLHRFPEPGEAARAMTGHQTPVCPARRNWARVSRAAMPA